MVLGPLKRLLGTSDEPETNLEGTLYCAALACDEPITKGPLYFEPQQGVVYHETNEEGMHCALDDIAARALERSSSSDAEPLDIEPISIEDAYELAQQGKLANRYEL